MDRKSDFIQLTLPENWIFKMQEIPTTNSCLFSIMKPDDEYPIKERMSVLGCAF